MARKHYNLPALTTLAAFETSARHGSFKKAAEELGVTPGAVSHQLKSLEEDLGLLLFERHYRGVEITKEGQLLFSVLQHSFSDISKTLNNIRKSSESEAITFAATTALSALWLTPRLTQFWKICGEVWVDQHVSDVFDHSRELPDLRVTYGYPRNPRPELQADVLFWDELVAVCSPEFYAAQKDISVAAIAKMPLIHLTAKDDRWTTWKEWFEAAGYDGEINEKFHVNNYMIALLTASEGAGVVIGWKKLLKPMLEKSELVIMGDTVMPSTKAFYLLYTKDNGKNENIRTLINYLLNSERGKLN
ncbi:MAG: LysR family transcriptional regulator [Cocleimonas sp.]